SVPSTLSSFLSYYRLHLHLHSFPTRRSSDLRIFQVDHRDHFERSQRLPVLAGRDTAFEFQVLELGAGEKADQLGFRAFAHDQHLDRKSTRLNSSHLGISYAVFCLKKKKNKKN